MKKFNGRFARTLMIGIATSFALASNSLANEREEAIKAISEHFKKVPTMVGEFVQFGPKGEQTGGRFFIKRPGKLHLDYEDPSPLKVISNGRTLAVGNSKLKTWNYYPLRKTPLSLLLDDEIKLKHKMIRRVDTANDMTTVVMGDKSVFGDSEITILFDSKTQDLRQWTVKDAQGKETSVLIVNVRKNVDIPIKYFVVEKKIAGQ